MRALKSPEQLYGSVLFPESVPDRMQVVADLRSAGVTVTQRPASGRFPWGMDLQHDAWGRAELLLPAEFPLPDEALLQQSVGLTPKELEAAMRRRSNVVLAMPTKALPLLEAVKRWLHWGRAAAGTTGLCLIDHRSHRVWSIAALDAELSHSAPLDVTALYAVHHVNDDENTVRWMHTHGLGDIGGFDLDIFNPSSEMLGMVGHDILRAFAFGVLEGQWNRTSRRVELVDGRPGRLLPWESFVRRAPEALSHLWKGSDHGGERAVFVEPGPLWQELTRSQVVPSRVTAGALDDIVVHFSTAATDAMAERARATWPWLVRILSDFEGEQREMAERLGIECYVKLGLRADAGGPFETEHPWFRVTDREAAHITGELLSQPQRLGQLTLGESYRWSVAQISGWMVRTPLGAILPHDDRVVRLLNELRTQP